MNKQRNNGYLLTEMIIGMSLLIVIVAGFDVTLSGFRMINHYYHTKQRCIAAAQAQLDSIAATGDVINCTDFDRLWPRMEFAVEKSAGHGQWDGLTLVKVTTKANSEMKPVKVTLLRYFPGRMGK